MYFAATFFGGLGCFGVPVAVSQAEVQMAEAMGEVGRLVMV